MAEGVGRLSLIVFDGGYERVHYALVMASAALATNRPATLFFTGPAVAVLRPEGWRSLGEAEATDRRFAGRNIATLAVLLDACRDLGARMIACEAALRARDLRPQDLRPDLAVEIAGIVTLLGQAGDGALLFV